MHSVSILTKHKNKEGPSMGITRVVDIRISTPPPPTPPILQPIKRQEEDSKVVGNVKTTIPNFQGCFASRERPTNSLFTSLRCLSHPRIMLKCSAGWNKIQILFMFEIE